MLRSFLGSLAAIGMLAAAPAPASADTFPDHAVTIVVPYAPGGSNDIAARILAIQLGSELKQSVVVENRGGAGGNVGATYAARARNDGYTVLMMSSAHIANRSLYRSLQYDVLKDFAPVAQVASNPYVMVVNADNPAQTLEQFASQVERAPTPLTYGSAGSGTSQHLAGALFTHRLKKTMTHVPYSGGAPAITDLLAGRIDVVFAPLSEVKPMLDAKRLRALAVTSAKRVESMPDLPAIAELLPGFELAQWNSFVVPAGTPKERVERLSQAVQRILDNPDTNRQLLARGIFPAYLGSEAFGEFMQSEATKWAEIVKVSGAEVN